MAQPQVITLSVDATDTDTFANEDYGQFTQYENRTIYVGANHSAESKDEMVLYRTLPKPAGNFKGTAKSAVKITRTTSATGVDGLAALSPTAIVESSFSFPVGMPSAERVAMLQAMGAALLDRTFIDTLTNKQEI